jgi:hypothetical protein
MAVIIITYGAAFLVLGIVFMIATAKEPYNEKAGLRKARVKRARMRGYYRSRVHYDNRVKRHHTTEKSYW